MNNNRIPYVTLIVNEDSKNNTDYESTDFEEEEEEFKNEFNIQQENNDQTITENERVVEVKINDIKKENVEGLFKKLNLLSNIKNLNFGIVEKLQCSAIAKSNLPPTSYVKVTFSSDPSNFTVS